MREHEQKLEAVTDPEALELFQELKIITGVDPAGFVGFSVFQFLMQCLFPNGGGTKAIKIKRRHLSAPDPYDRFIVRKKSENSETLCTQSFEAWQPYDQKA